MSKRRHKAGKVTVRHADGSVEVVKQGHFDKKRRSPNPRTAYEAYLRSTHWKQVRKAALARDDNRCTACGDDCYLEVHHLTYERLGRELLSDVVTLCQWCHRDHHRGVKVISKEAA